MQRPSWDDYYAKVINQPHRPLLEDAVALLPTRSGAVAVDCGCGAGRDSAYLLRQALTVHAFDNEADAIQVCEQRFVDEVAYSVTQSSFETYEYPSADLIVAHASLFFCPPDQFERAWHKMSAALKPGGVFCGDFLGVRDAWATGNGRIVSAFEEQQVRALFEGFDIVEWRERDEFGRTAIGREKQWHYYTVLAVKTDLS